MRAGFGYRGHTCQCQTDQLSADQCSSQYPLLYRPQPETTPKSIPLIQFMIAESFSVSCVQYLCAPIYLALLHKQPLRSFFMFRQILNYILESRDYVGLLAGFL